MGTLSRRSNSVRALTLMAMAALGACQAAPDDPDVGSEPPTSIVLDSTLTHEQVLEGLLNSPCDAVIAPSDNEQHDCQRLVMLSEGELVFGPLVGIFPDTLTLMNPADSFLVPRPVAHVTNAGPFVASQRGEYRELGVGPAPAPATRLRTSISCLWLQLTDSGTWRGALAPLPLREEITNCGEPPAGSAWNLEVRRQRYGSTDLAGYPNTARWQWTTPGDSLGMHYIGIKCGDGWCAMGAPDFTPDSIPDEIEEPDPLRAIPGFHDAQFLAVMRDGQLTPGPWGAVYHVRGVPPNGPGVFRRAARFEVADPPGPYQRKLLLSQVGSVWVSEIWMLPAPPPARPTAQYRNPAGGSAQARDVLTASKGHGTHLSARWRWQESKDESVWVPCQAYGCCDIDEAL